MSTFEGREEAFEKKFAHDEELQFKAEARRDKLLALWAAEKLGRSGPAAEQYVNEILAAELAAPGGGKVFEKLRSDFDSAGVSISDRQIRRRMEELLQESLTKIRVTG